MHFCPILGNLFGFKLLKYVTIQSLFLNRIFHISRLHDQLQHALPNTALPLPHLPGLSYYDRFLSIFSRNQREGAFFQEHLDKYFKDLARIPEVVRSTHFRLFLEAFDASDKVALVLGPNVGIGTVPF